MDRPSERDGQHDAARRWHVAVGREVHAAKADEGEGWGMLSEEQIRAMIVARFLRMAGSCNDHHINQLEDQIRALIAVLNDGKMPPISKSVRAYCRAAGVPVLRRGSETGWSDEWLLEHGFERKRAGDDSTWYHPTLENW